MPLKTEAIKRFLVASTFSDLASLYSSEMEVQVNCAQDNGTRIEGDFEGRKWRGFTDGITTWKHIRIPWNANKQPEYIDSEIKFELDKHAEGIGMTGWNWQKKKSIYIGYDFDSIINHQAGLSSEDLEEIKEAISKIPWVTIRKSTSGNGYHIYVFLNLDIEIKTHNEHSALARSILGQMAGITGFDLKSKVDSCGNILWIWHRKMKDTDGLTLIKKGSILTEVPLNWTEHIKVITGNRRRILPQEIEERNHGDLFDSMTSQRMPIPLDSEHKKLIDWLQSTDTMYWWDADNHLLVTHTKSLKDAHTTLNLKGIFETVSKGKDQPNDINVFCAPMIRGAWNVRRFTLGVQEAPSWSQDPGGWTHCYLNREPDLRTISLAKGGIEDTNGSFVFREADVAVEAAKHLGVHAEVATPLRGRKTKLRQHKDGRLIIEIEHDPQDRADEMVGWLPDKGKWLRIFNTKTLPPTEIDAQNYDDIIRHVVTEADEDFGWVIKNNGYWLNEPLVHIKLLLKSMGYVEKDINGILGVSVSKCWRLVNKPFQPEYPGERQWNKNSAQLRFKPSDSENLSHPTWDLVFNHVGQGLDDALKLDYWARRNNVVTGADYLKLWVRSLITEPLEALPYLFLFSKEQLTGKSVFHEALSLLFLRGYIRADAALTNQSSFNAELEGSILCVIEETDLRRNKNAYNLMKDWITSRDILIHRKGCTPYHARNSCHFIQTANDFNHCPIFPGDTRIVALYVKPINPLDLIQKKKLLISLEFEAPDFIASILKLDTPAPGDRLNLPVITTEEKIAVQATNMSMLEVFLAEKCQIIDGHKIKISDFWDLFVSWLDPSEIHSWSKIRLGREMPLSIVKGRDHSTGKWYYGNLAWANEVNEPKPFKYICKADYLEEQT